VHQGPESEWDDVPATSVEELPRGRSEADTAPHSILTFAAALEAAAQQDDREDAVKMIYGEGQESVFRAIYRFFPGKRLSRVEIDNIVLALREELTREKL